ncbi:MAG: tRNA (adenosine(37)-N6)-threonylcarbamoyltransferase complex ATPase subunit type 1 TsaE [Acidobacteriota bacterium]
MSDANGVALRPSVYDSAAPEDTEGLAARLASGLRPGDRIELHGPLGSGKTTFVRGLARGLGLNPNDVHSPTFTMVHRYRGEITLMHADLYRVHSAEGYEELGLEEDAGASVLVIEWAERLPSGAPEATVQIHFEITGERSRRLHVSRRPPAA